MNVRNLILVTLALSGAALFLVLQKYPKDISSPEQPQVQPQVPIIQKPASRSPAPDFTLTDLDANPFQLSGSKGNVLVMMFWTTW